MIVHQHPYMYVVTHKGLSPEQQAVQAMHAAMEATCEFLTEKSEHPALIWCALKDEEALRSLVNMLLTSESKQHNMKNEFVAFYEPDIGGRLTAIATIPLAFDSEKRGNFSYIPLVRIGMRELILRKKY